MAEYCVIVVGFDVKIPVTAPVFFPVIDTLLVVGKVPPLGKDPMAGRVEKILVPFTYISKVQALVGNLFKENTGGAAFVMVNV